MAADASRPDPAALLTVLQATDPENLRGVRTKRIDEQSPTLGEAAFHGLVGEIVRGIEPFTEACEPAVLVQVLGFFGNVVGLSPHGMVGAERHGTNIYPIIVGRSAKARKGSSLAPVDHLFRLAAPDWHLERRKSGLSSGEGLVYQVRDDDGDELGVSDKRLLIVEGEFARVLKVMRREGNILSPTLRDAWDGKPLGSLTKSTPTRTSSSHISIIGHITEDELRRELTATEATNGFVNRFLFVLAWREKQIPRPRSFDGPEVLQLVRSLRDRIDWGSAVERVDFSEEAGAAWDVAYCGELAQEWPGLVGSMTARSEAQVLRLAMIYALADQSARIQAVHIDAALAVWRYSAATIRHVFGDALGHPIADRIRQALREAPNGLTRKQISVDVLSKNVAADSIADALDLLLELGLARQTVEATGGRPAELWVSCEH
jgi:hypothetical protein